MISDKKLIQEALMLAIKAHDGQRRKYTGEPYSVHPIGVSKIVETVDHTPEMIAAALLHDVVEDTPVHFEKSKIPLVRSLRSMFIIAQTFQKKMTAIVNSVKRWMPIILL